MVDGEDVYPCLLCGGLLPRNEEEIGEVHLR